MCNCSMKRLSSDICVQVFIQSFLICLINVVAAYIYVYMQYFTPSKWLVIVGQMAWQLSAGLFIENDSH